MSFTFSKWKKYFALRLLLILEGVEYLNLISALEDLNDFNMSVTNLSGVITPNLFHTGLKHISWKAYLQMRLQHSHLYKMLSCASVLQTFICSFLQKQYFLAILQLQVPKHISDAWNKDRVMKSYGTAGLLSSQQSVCSLRKHY